MPSSRPCLRALATNGSVVRRSPPRAHVRAASNAGGDRLAATEGSATSPRAWLEVAAVAYLFARLRVELARSLRQHVRNEKPDIHNAARIRRNEPVDPARPLLPSEPVLSPARPSSAEDDPLPMAHGHDLTF